MTNTIRDLLRRFDDLGARVEEEWRRKDYDDEQFPQIAVRLLKEARLSDDIDPWDVVRWIHTTTTLPFQADLPASFGNPPITLFRGPRFYIDIYFWVDGTTAIHQHAFGGAFQVLLGGSIQTQFEFQLAKEVSPHFLVGEIHRRQVDLLGKGDVCPIVPGNRYIHSLFHLERPSATIVVRTNGSPSGAPQYSYLPPCFAVDPFFSEPLETRRRQTVALLLNVRHAETDKFVAELIENADFHTTFNVLRMLSETLSNDPMEKTFDLETGVERYEKLLALARTRHPELAARIPEILAEERRLNNIASRRNQITSADHRFFMALLLNLHDRAKLLEFVGKRVPEGDPVDTVLGWVDELANTKVLNSSEANVLGIADYDEVYQYVLGGLFEGLGPGGVKERYFAELPGEANAEMASKLERLCGSIRESLLFKAVLAK